MVSRVPAYSNPSVIPLGSLPALVPDITNSRPTETRPIYLAPGGRKTGSDIPERPRLRAGEAAVCLASWGPSCMLSQCAYPI